MLVREPNVINNHFFVCAQALDNLATLPIPKHDVSTASTAGNVLAIGREPDIARVSGGRVACKSLLFRLLERSVGGID